MHARGGGEPAAGTSRPGSSARQPYGPIVVGSAGLRLAAAPSASLRGGRRTVRRGCSVPRTARFRREGRQEYRGHAVRTVELGHLRQRRERGHRQVRIDPGDERGDRARHRIRSWPRAGKYEPQTCVPCTLRLGAPPPNGLRWLLPSRARGRGRAPRRVRCRWPTRGPSRGATPRSGRCGFPRAWSSRTRCSRRGWGRSGAGVRRGTEPRRRPGPPP